MYTIYTIKWDAETPVCRVWSHIQKNLSSLPCGAFWAHTSLTIQEGKINHGLQRDEACQGQQTVHAARQQESHSNFLQ